MTTWLLPKARPISGNDCPAFQRLHSSVLCTAESLTHLACVINTTFREKIYNRWCCIDRLSWDRFPGLGERCSALLIASCGGVLVLASASFAATDRVLARCLALQ